MSFARFSERIHLLGRKIDDNAGELTMKAAVAAMTSVILGTPVDTGRARGNWNLSIGSPDFSVDEGKKDPGGYATIKANEASISNYPLVKNFAPNAALFITNNLNYIGKLNAGSSKQAPANFVRISAVRAVSAIKGVRVLP